tara:strand:+ start:576 stop:1178 length:603 start_codon:yes stop_codon:yes gene_type:complete
VNIPKPVIFDNFYTNPYRVRDVALSLDYWGCRDHPTGGNWPGERSLYVNQVAPELFNSFVKNIYRIWGWPDSKSVLFDMNFQICKAADGDSWVHQDVMPQNYTHVALVYLNPNPYANSGTCFYNLEADPESQDYKNSDGDPRHYSVSLVADNVFNRCVVYSPDEFHKSDVYFGSNRVDSRLTQVAFFREEGALEKFSQPL